MVALEGGLQVAQRVAVAAATGLCRQAFDGLYRATVDLHGQHQAGALRDAVDAHGAGAADAVFAAHMGAGLAEFVAQEIAEQLARFGGGASRLAVQQQLHGVGAVAGEHVHAGVPAEGWGRRRLRSARACMATRRPSWRTSWRRSAALAWGSSRASSCQAK